MPHYTCDCGAKIGAATIELLRQTIHAHKETCSGAYELERSLVATTSLADPTIPRAHTYELERPCTQCGAAAAIQCITSCPLRFTVVRDGVVRCNTCGELCSAGQGWEEHLRDVRRPLPHVELAATHARELARDIGLDADDAAGLERAVRRSAAGDPTHWRVEPRIMPSFLDELEAALLSGGILTLGAGADLPSTRGSIHAIIETDDGARFAQCKGADVLGVLLDLLTLWKTAQEKPPPQCQFCSAPLEGVLIGNNLNVGHSVPICVAFGTERTRNSCVPPHAFQQLLAAELRKQKAVAR